MVCKGYKAQERVYKKGFWIQTDRFEIQTSRVFRQLFCFLIIHLWKSQNSSWLIQDCWDKEDYMCKTWKVSVFITSLLFYFDYWKTSCEEVQWAWYQWRSRQQGYLGGLLLRGDGRMTGLLGFTWSPYEGR